MEVKTEETTVTTRTYTLKLTEAELTAALVDAKPLQRELRKARNEQIAPAANWATAGYAGHAPRSSQAKVKRAREANPAQKSSAGKVQCPGCGASFSPQGLGPHKAKCAPYQLHKVATAAQAAA